MIAFFPQIHKGELIYSLISRYHVRTGFPQYIFTAQDVYKNRLVRPDIEFVNQFSEEAQSWLNETDDWSVLLDQHTMLPSYIRFLPKQRKINALKSIIDRENNWRNLVCVPTNKEKRFLRYCPVCATEDRKEFGETYWHREHQLQKIKACPKHQCYVVESAVGIGARNSPGLFDAESQVPNKPNIRTCENKKELAFSQYVIDVFHEPIDILSPLPVGRYLRSKLGKEYLNETGLVKSVTQLYADYVDFFDGMPVMSQTYMDKLFNGYHFDSYFVLQLAYFLGLSVKEIAKLPDDIPVFGLDALYMSLAKKHNVDFALVFDIAKTVTNYYNHHTRVQKKSGRFVQSYDELDDKYLPLVESEVNKLMNSPGRPKKLSFAFIERTLNLTQKQIYKLPKCFHYVNQHMETQREYWAREVVWAVKEIREAKIALTCKHILKKTNMRKQDLGFCLGLILDKELQEEISKLLG